MFEVILLAIVQGLTEFLPISSSGHLVLTQGVVTLSLDEVTVDIVLHLGTLLSISVVFYRDILSLLTTRRSWIPLIIIASIPAFLGGFLLQDYLEQLVHMPLLVGCFLMLNGIILFTGARLSEKKQEQPLTRLSALLVGVAQAFAMIPGISRSGSTISTAMVLGWSRKDAAKFSFIMSIPVIFGAALYKLLHESVELTGSMVGTLIVALVVAALVGYIALKIVLRVLYHGKFVYFAYYCMLVGFIYVVIQLIR